MLDHDRWLRDPEAHRGIAVRQSCRPEEGGSEADVVIRMFDAAVVDIGNRIGDVVARHSLGMYELSSRALERVCDRGFVSAREESTRDEPDADQCCERLATQLQS